MWLRGIATDLCTDLLAHCQRRLREPWWVWALCYAATIAAVVWITRERLAALPLTHAVAIVAAALVVALALHRGLFWCYYRAWAWLLACLVARLGRDP